MIQHLTIVDPKARNLPDDLSEESFTAIANSIVKVVRDAVSVDISIEREMIPCKSVNLSMSVVTLPPDLTNEQRAEIDFCLQEIGGIFRYAGE